MHMHPISVDVREACRSVRTGKGQWTYGFVTELIARKIPLTLFTDAEVPNEWRNHSHVGVALYPRGIRWHWEVKRTLEDDGGVYISPLSYLVPAFFNTGAHYIPVVHDLIAFRPEAHQWKARVLERLTLGRALRAATHVCTISQSTKQDLLEHFPFMDARRVTPVFAAPMKSDVTKNTHVASSILCIATLCPRKNQRRLIEAYAMLPDALRSVFSLELAGARGWQDEEILTLAARTPGVRLLGAVTDAEYERLLGSCTVFALPSLYEGFGMQLLDAVQRGVPVLTSKRGSIPEVCGDSAEYVDPESVASIARGLERLLTDPARREHLAAIGPKQAAAFTWPRTADLLLDAVERALGTL